MIKCMGITHEDKVQSNLHIKEATSGSYQWIWVDFVEPSEKEIEHLSYTFGFHPLAIEDCVHRLQRPKLDYYEEYTFYVTHSVREENRELLKEELDFFVDSNFIVTFHRAASKEITHVWEKLASTSNTEKWDTYYVFYEVLDKIVDHYFPLIYQIEDDLDKIEDNTQRKSMNALMRNCLTQDICS